MILNRRADPDDPPAVVVWVFVVVISAVLALVLGHVVVGVASTFGVTMTFNQGWAWSTVGGVAVVAVDQVAATAAALVRRWRR